jgi:hypothetical protein
MAKRKNDNELEIDVDEYVINDGSNRSCVIAMFMSRR